MRKRMLAVVMTVLLCFTLLVNVSANDAGSIVVNGSVVELTRNPVVIDGKKMIPIRSVAEAMQCEVSWDSETQSTLISNGQVSVSLRMDHVDMKVVRNGVESTVMMDIPPILIDNSTYLPLRVVVETLGGSVYWDSDSDVTYVEYPAQEEQHTEYAGSAHNPDAHTFYFQNEARFSLPYNGSGYCWVCSYAMVLTDVMGYAITPVDVANVNISNGANGNYCYHAQIVSAFGAKFVPAVDTASPYYKGYDIYFGLTYLNTPDEQSAINALKEALDRNPAGVLVRFEGFSPHTIVATGYQGNTIYFNEPMPYGYGYSETSIYQNVTFDQTHPGGYCGFGLKDMTAIQAIAQQ